MSWSSGKDSAFALHRARQSFEIAALLTTTTQDRVAMHGVRAELVDAQARALGLPCRKIALPWPCPNQVYEREVGVALAAARDEGVTHVVFGDLFLEDIRAYRAALLASFGLVPVFPLWGLPTRALAEEMIDAGVKAIVTSVDLRRLGSGFAGRAFDRELLADLPPDVDPCAENGEFHTFVRAGPMFGPEIRVVAGELVEQGGFAVRDLLLQG